MFGIETTRFLGSCWKAVDTVRMQKAELARSAIGIQGELLATHDVATTARVMDDFGGMAEIRGAEGGIVAQLTFSPKKPGELWVYTPVKLTGTEAAAYARHLPATHVLVPSLLVVRT
jgi:hypothetical protein